MRWREEKGEQGKGRKKKEEEKTKTEEETQMRTERKNTKSWSEERKMCVEGAEEDGDKRKMVKRKEKKEKKERIKRIRENIEG